MCDQPTTSGRPCKYPDGSFACKIRHQQINTGVARSSDDVSRGKETVQINPSERLLR